MCPSVNRNDVIDILNAADSLKKVQEAVNQVVHSSNLDREDLLEISAVVKEKKMVGPYIQCLERAAEISKTEDPNFKENDPIVLLNLAKAYEFTKKYDKAMATVKNGISCDPFNPEFHKIKAKILTGMNRISEATQAMSEYENLKKKSHGSHKGDYGEGDAEFDENYGI